MNWLSDGRHRYGGLLSKAVLLAAVAFTRAAWAGDQDIAQESLAGAIREAGYSCEHVIAMKRSRDGAAQGFTVWVVHCNSGDFRVIFKGDTGSEVVRLG